MFIFFLYFLRVSTLLFVGTGILPPLPRMAASASGSGTQTRLNSCEFVRRESEFKWGLDMGDCHQSTHLFNFCSTHRTTPIKFMEKNRVSDQTLCSAFSPGESGSLKMSLTRIQWVGFFSEVGGKFFVTGGTDRIIRVYQCIPDPPTLVAELNKHQASCYMKHYASLRQSCLILTHR